MAKPVHPKPAEANSTNTNFYENYIKGREFYFLLGSILLCCYIIFQDFISMKKIYLFKDIGSDSLNATWPYMTQTKDILTTDGFPSWSFNFGMGQNMSTFGFYDPFDVLIYMFGKSKMIYVLAFKEILKIVLSGILFYKYLKLLAINNFSAATGAFLFCFSGYMIVGSGWFIFSFEAFTLTLLLWSFEMFFQKGKWYWFPLPIFLIGASRPFNLWLFGIFIIIYLVFRIVQSGFKIDFTSISFLILKFIGLVIIGVGLSAPLFLEHLQVMIDSPRGSGPDSYFHVLSSGPMFANPDKMQFGTEILRFFSSDILGSGIKFKGWQNYLEAPLFYCGLLSLLLMPQVFQFFSGPLKKVSVAVLLIWTLPIIFPYFRQAFWLFAGDYYRAYSFFVAITILFYSILAFNFILTKKVINVKVLIGTLIVLLFFVNYPFFKDKSVIDSSLLMCIILLLLIYSALIYLIAVKRDNNSYKLLLFACLFCELSYFSWCSVNRRDHLKVAELSQKKGYNDFSLEAVNFIKESDKSFYRIDKSYSSTPAIHGSLNDALIFNYYGTSCYSSFNQLNYINYFKSMNVISKVNETESRWAPGLINRFILESVNGVKYVLTKNTNNPVWLNSFDSIAKFGDVIVLKNKNVLPIGFAYNKFLRLSDFEKLSPLQKDLVSSRACVVNDIDLGKFTNLQPFQLKDTVTVNAITFEIIKQNFDTLKSVPFNVSHFSHTHIDGNINIKAAGSMIYFSIPFDKGWTITENGKPIEKLILSNGMTGVYLGKGLHNLDLSYKSANMKNGLTILVITSIIFLLLLFYSILKKPIVENR